MSTHTPPFIEYSLTILFVRNSEDFFPTSFDYICFWQGYSQDHRVPKCPRHSMYLHMWVNVGSHTFSHGSHHRLAPEFWPRLANPGSRQNKAQIRVEKSGSLGIGKIGTSTLSQVSKDTRNQRNDKKRGNTQGKQWWVHHQHFEYSLLAPNLFR